VGCAGFAVEGLAVDGFAVDGAGAGFCVCVWAASGRAANGSAKATIATRAERRKEWFM
jgi:sugar lactone lactonase YvrE